MAGAIVTFLGARGMSEWAIWDWFAAPQHMAGQRVSDVDQSAPLGADALDVRGFVDDPPDRRAQSRRTTACRTRHT